MKDKKNNNKLFGLVGKNIGYSFSKNYFTSKFAKEGIAEATYQNFDIPSIIEFNNIKDNYYANLKGLNVTIPYKETIFDYLTKVEEKAKKIGAVNTIKFCSNGNLTGYNTDEYGFRKSIQHLLKTHHTKALILGTGGASKAVAYALDYLNIAYKYVSRTKRDNCFTYADLNDKVISRYTIIINCTPIGTFPDTEKHPNIPYQYLTKAHLLYDLIYNPSETLFLKKGKEKGAMIKNGYEMLVLQAEKAWEIWNS